MKKLTLRPNQLIVPGEDELGNNAILQIYFRVFDEGHGDSLPRVIVAHKDAADMFLDPTKLKEWHVHYRHDKIFMENYNRILRHNYDSGAQYFLLDGNHRATAAALTHQPISALELGVDADIDEGEAMVQTGDLFNWTVPGRTLVQAMEKLQEHLKHYLRKTVEDIDSLDRCIVSYPLTFKDRADALTSNGKVPEYMIERYQAK